MRFDFLHEIRFRLRANELIHHLAAFDEKDGGNTRDAVVDGQLGVVVDIDLSDIDPAIVLFR